jgi:hypothetical protein
MKNLYNENYKPLKKEIEEDIRKWKDLACLWIGRINIVKMAILPKAMFMSNAIPIKIPITSQRLKSNPKFHIETQKTTNSQGTNEQKKQYLQCRVYFKLYYRALAIKVAWYCHKNRHKRPMEQNRRPIYKSEQLLPLIFDKAPKTYDKENTVC